MQHTWWASRRHPIHAMNTKCQRPNFWQNQIPTIKVLMLIHSCLVKSFFHGTDFNCKINSPLQNGPLQCPKKNANIAMKFIPKGHVGNTAFHLYIYVLCYICCGKAWREQIVWRPKCLPYLMKHTRGKWNTAAMANDQNCNGLVPSVIQCCQSEIERKGSFEPAPTKCYMKSI